MPGGPRHGRQAGRQACAVMMCGEMGKREKRSSPCAVERGRTEDLKVVRNKLMTSGPGMLPRAMSRSMALPQPGSL